MSRKTLSVAALLGCLIALAVDAAEAGPHSGAYSVAIQPNGKIVAAGWGERGFQEVFGLARYEQDGALDTNFGLRGKVTTPVGADARAGGIVLQPDGKIVAAGHGGGFFSNSWDFAVVRYTPKGALDPSFGTGGEVRTAFGSAGSAATAVTIQANGKILAAGYTQSGTKYKFALARYRPNGSLDTSFGTGGRVTTKVGSNGGASDVVVQANGKVVAAGTSSDDFVLLRYNANGSLDTSFGTGGEVTTAFGFPADAHALALQTDGKLIVAGGGRTGAGGDPKYEFVLARYTPDGSLDPSFGTGGKVRTSFVACICDLSYGAEANAVDVQPNGKIVAAGQELNGGARGAFALARYNPGGSLDTGFGSGGKVATSFGFAEPANGTSGDAATAVDLLSNGKIIAAGYSQFGPHTEQYLFALARYRANGSLDTSFGKGGKVNTSVAACVVPNLKGQKLVSAEGRIRRSHCAVGTVRNVFSSRVKKKHVISQEPRPGTLGPEATKVRLVVSRGPA